MFTYSNYDEFRIFQSIPNYFFRNFCFDKKKKKKKPLFYFFLKNITTKKKKYNYYINFQSAAKDFI